ncbi:aldose 1-epimerase [Novosphingobium sp. FSY-8]|uniref:Aldose 1-epimerase n=1 Tax=Novosphingobium ovatum TaxID=1908523 RepID=A0ABW9XC77_9SPHN|nr:aldose 1-epimerase [Novosphingobium ovatum]NBC36151.1 aldose 1-epimerase [Novosphingobium ovatum]
MILLRHGDWSCDLAPELGGAVATLRHAGVDVLRPLPAGAADVLEAGSFPLVPFCNRIGQGRLPWAGQEYRLSTDVAAPLHALHGHGWRRAWQVVRADPVSATLALTHQGDAGWPWDYRVAQVFDLTDEGLSLTISVTSLADEPMPMGIGIHPYFLRTPGSRVEAASGTRWENDVTGLATHAVSDDRFAMGRAVAVDALEGLDHFFAAPDGALPDSLDLAVEQPFGRVRIWADQARGFHLFAPAGLPYFCVEPVSHAPDAFGRGEVGAADILAPGETRDWAFAIGLED